MKRGDRCCHTSLGQVWLDTKARTHSSAHPLLEETYFRGEKAAVSFSHAALSFLPGASAVVGWCVGSMG